MLTLRNKNLRADELPRINIDSLYILENFDIKYGN